MYKMVLGSKLLLLDYSSSNLRNGLSVTVISGAEEAANVFQIATTTTCLHPSPNNTGKCYIIYQLLGKPKMA